MSAELNREEWLKERSKGLGGSDVAAALGISPFVTPLQLWMEKTGRATPKEENLSMRIGTLMEPILRQLYTIKTGRELVPNDFRIFRHPKHPILSSTPDAFEVGNDALGVELKDVGYLAAKAWGLDGTDEVPEYYLCQIAVEMATALRQNWYCAAKLDRDFRVYPIKRDPDLEEAIIEGAERFWRDYVITDKPPEAGRLDTEALKGFYPKDASDEIKQATELQASRIAQLIETKAVLRDAEDNETELVNALKQDIGESAGLIAPGVGKATWKVIKGKTVTNWEAIVNALNPAPLLIQQHTKVIAGPRRFVVTGEKEKKP